VIPHLPKDFHNTSNLARKLSIDKGYDPFDNITLPCRLCLHSSILAKYPSYGISIATLSPFMQGCGNWLKGTSQTLLNA